ncbi:MAG: FAD-binding oxidoreductase, partial [Gammaproteobacteria bacterium]
MDPIVTSLQQALGPGGVLTGEDARNRSGSWGLAHCDALAVLRPANTAEVATALRICHAAGQPVVPEGGKTGLVNGARAAPGEIAISLERMRRIEQIDVAGRTMIVEAGATLQSVQEAAEGEG